MLAKTEPGVGAHVRYMDVEGACVYAHKHIEFGVWGRTKKTHVLRSMTYSVGVKATGAKTRYWIQASRKGERTNDESREKLGTTTHNTNNKTPNTRNCKRHN